MRVRSVGFLMTGMVSLLLDWRCRLLSMATLTLTYMLISSLLIRSRRDGQNYEDEEVQGEIYQEMMIPDEQTVITRVPTLQNTSTSTSRAEVIVSEEKKLNNDSSEWCTSTLSFKPAKGPVVALASFPGSGNTWLRYLLQQATGILTGSIYHDSDLLQHGFPGENVMNNTVLVVKTHRWGGKARGLFQKAILLVRDPVYSALAEFNRQAGGGHLAHASPEMFGRHNSAKWRAFVQGYGQAWENMNLDWALRFKGPLLVVFYEDLVKNLEAQLRKILEFLSVTVKKETLSCVLERKDGRYRRPKKDADIDSKVYSSQQRKFLEKKQKYVYALLNENMMEK